jgi:abortive infection alpha-like protein
MNEDGDPIGLAKAVELSGIPAAIELVSDFAQKLLGPAAEEAGELFRDEVRDLRQRRWLKRLARAKELAEASGRDVKSVPLRTLLPLRDAASLEDEPELAEMWSALLANASTNSEGGAARPAFVEMLRQLSPEDAAELSRRWVRHGLPLPTSWKVGNLWEGGDGEVGLEVENRRAILTNLERLGIVSSEPAREEDLRVLYAALESAFGQFQRKGSYSMRAMGEVLEEAARMDIPIGDRVFSLTPLGVRFLVSVLPPIARPLSEPWGSETSDAKLADWVQQAEGLAVDLAFDADLAAQLKESVQRAEQAYHDRTGRSPTKRDGKPPTLFELAD